MKSPDGVHFTPIKPPEVVADFRLPGEYEVGGIRKFGEKYYIIGGTGNPPHFGFTGYGVYTYTAQDGEVQFSQSEVLRHESLIPSSAALAGAHDQ